MSKNVKISSYDFKEADKFTREQMRTLHLVFDNIARSFSIYLSSILQTGCEVEVSSTSKNKYQDIINAQVSPVILAVISMPPLHGSVLMEVTSAAVNNIINLLFGGKENTFDSNKDFTEIDLVIIEKIILQLIPLIDEAWSKIVKVKSSLEKIETNYQFAKIAEPDENMVVANFNLTANKISGDINIYIPYLSIEPISKNLSSKLYFTGKTSKPFYNKNNNSNVGILQNTPLVLKAILSNITMSIEEILSLRAGDVIQLDKRVGEPVHIEIEDIPKAYGKLGAKDKKYAIKLETFIKDEEGNTHE